MNRKTLVARFYEIATLLELSGADPFRIRSYQNAARTLESTEEDVESLVREGRVTELRGIGKSIGEKIETLVGTGSLPLLEELRGEIPGGVVELLRVPDLGPKTARMLHDELGIDSIEALEAAASAGALRGLKGFGKKTEENLLLGIARIRRHTGRHRIHLADRIARRIVDGLPVTKGDRVEIGGSLRRRRETIRDVDVVVGTKTPGRYLDAFVGLEGVERITGRGETKASVVFDDGIAADLRVVEPSQFPFALVYFTGSKAHNTRLRSLAIDRKLKLNEYGLFPDGKERSVRCRTEAEVYQRLGLSFVPAPMREDTDEFERYALDVEPPRLVEASDLRGVVHCHSRWSDGKRTIEEMALECRSRGASYLGITDHSQSAVYANGLTPERVKMQAREVAALNRKLDSFRILFGIEVDILPDGGLDYSDDVLAGFDFVLASVHSAFRLEEDRMMARMEKALRHPEVDVLGHATGRFLLERDPYAVDMDRIVALSAECGVALEINANPKRLDVDWRVARSARERGVPILICPDAHDVPDLDYLRYGIDMAQKAGLSPDDVLNTRGADGFLEGLRGARGKEASDG